MTALRKATIRALLVTTCLTAPVVAYAQDTAPTSLEDVVITGQITYRDRTDTVAPELSYDQEFFEKFEPVSVGDQLKRVPGVAFTSDIGEYDAPQLRGLGFGFTQILINGRPVPGAGNDRSVFVDRIPAEIIDRIEIIRSPSADIDSQGVGGTINIILKDGQSLPPGVIARAGANYNADSGETSPSASVSISGRTDDERMAWSLTFDAQKRFNEKSAVEEVFNEDSAGFAASSNGLNLFSQGIGNSVAVERVEQADRRESEDLSFNADLTINVSDRTTLRLDGYYLTTDRHETEDEIAWERDDSTDPFDPPEFAGQDTQIEQASFGVSAVLDVDFSDTVSFEGQIRFAQFNETSDTFELDGGLVGGTPVESVLIDSEDAEWSGDGAFKFQLPGLVDSAGLSSASLKVGMAAKSKTRDYSQREFEDLDTTPSEITAGNGVFKYEERRLDTFVVGEFGLTDSVKLQLGVRGEYTETEQTLPGGLTASNDVFEWNPSAHLQWEVTGSDQIRISVARTVRRPSLDQIVPFTNNDSPEDDDVTIGNAGLEMETSWGLDIGYERRFAGRGVFGINFFRREVSNLISLVNTGVGTPGGGNVYTFANVGDGKVSGFEVDLSTPLSFLGLDETGVFGNYTRLWSERTDPNTGDETRFNNQPAYVYNFGVTQNLPSWNASFGFSYQKQGRYDAYFLGEFEQGQYDANLEIFIEKRLGDNVVVRLSGNNLLDAASTQNEKGYDGDTGAEIIANQQAGDVDSFEIEREESSPTFTFTVRAVF